MSETFTTLDENGVHHTPAEPRKGMIRVLIADDHPIVRDGLRKLLSLEEDFQVVGEASDGCEVLDRVQELDPDVLLLDLRMPNLDGLSALQALQQTNKRTRVIVLTASEDKNEFVQAMKLGCSGIVLKQTAPELIVSVPLPWSPMMASFCRPSVALLPVTVAEPPSAAVRAAPLLFALAIFTSAALVFMVEPMIAKLVLPKLGGSPAVWNTSMVFFQLALLGGYAYAHLIQRSSP